MITAYVQSIFNTLSHFLGLLYFPFSVQTSFYNVDSPKGCEDGLETS